MQDRNYSIFDYFKADSLILSNHDLCFTELNKLVEDGYNHIVKLKEANKDLVLNTMIPAYEDMIKGLEPLRGTGIGDYQGVCAYKNGKEYYEELVRQYSGSTMSIPQMKKEFEEQRQNLLNEAQKMFMENPDLLNQLMTEPLKIKVLSDPNEILEQLQEKASVLYPKLEGIEFGVKYVDPSLEPYSAPAFVYPISLDGNKEYTVNINKGSLGGADIWSTVAHEGYPGHLYQMLYVKQLEDDFDIHLPKEDIDALLNREGNIGRPWLALILIKYGYCNYWCRFYRCSACKKTY